MITSAEFDVWWNKNGVKTDVPVLAESYREIAWKAWRAGLDGGYGNGYSDATDGEDLL